MQKLRLQLVPPARSPRKLALLFRSQRTSSVVAVLTDQLVEALHFRRAGARPRGHLVQVASEVRSPTPALLSLLAADPLARHRHDYGPWISIPARMTAQTALQT